MDSEVEGARLSHVYNSAQSGEAPAFLGDWAHLLNALLAAHAHTAQESYLERAKSVALEVVDRFFDESKGGFFDAEADPRAVGYLQLREKPLADNLTAVLGLLKLNQAAKNDDYRPLTEATLSAFAETYRQHGEFAGAYGLLVDLWLNAPVEITIEGAPEDSSTLKMLRASAAPSLSPLGNQAFAGAKLPAAGQSLYLFGYCMPAAGERRGGTGGDSGKHGLGPNKPHRKHLPTVSRPVTLP